MFSKKIYFLSFAIAVLAFSAVLVGAQDDDPFADIVYPVSELGNCTDKEDCLAYCDNPDNMEPCLDFAEANNLIPEEDIEMGRKMLTAGETSGPGGCQGVVECGNYCDDISNIKECIAFAKEHDLIPADELEEAEKVIAALDRGVQPPPCNSKTECDDICRLPENMKTCIIFAKEAGLMPPEELEEAEKVLAALEKGIQPPPCGSKDDCDEYCSQPENFESCISFAEAAGFMSADEATMARKTGGKGPGDCRGKEACESFCEDPANGEVCINFAIENGFMSAEEGEQAKKMMASGINIMEGGPGGCKGREECEAFCDDISNMEECVNFAERAGFMSSEDAARARRMAEKGINMMQGGPGGCQSQEECEAFCEDPGNMEICLDFSVKIGDMSPEQAEQMRGNVEMMQRGGPGGCRDEQECRAYCDDPSHGQECLDFAVQMGQISPEEAQGMMEGQQQMQQQEMQQQGQMTPQEMPPEGMAPEQFQEQFQQEFQQQYEQQYQQQYQEQYQQQQQQQQMEQQMQQMMPPQEAPPQSFLDKTQNFLGSLINNLLGK